MASSETVNLGLTFDPGTATVADNGKAPRKRTTPKAAVTAAAPAKRAGRPAAPQTVEESLSAFLSKTQAARKILNDARNILVRMVDVASDPAAGGDHGLINWNTRSDICRRLADMDYDLHAAQMTIGRTGFSNPTDKI